MCFLYHLKTFDLFLLYDKRKQHSIFIILQTTYYKSMFKISNTLLLILFSLIFSFKSSSCTNLFLLIALHTFKKISKMFFVFNKFWKNESRRKFYWRYNLPAWQDKFNRFYFFFLNYFKNSKFSRLTKFAPWIYLQINWLKIVSQKLQVCTRRFYKRTHFLHPLVTCFHQDETGQSWIICSNWPC